MKKEIVISRLISGRETEQAEEYAADFFSDVHIVAKNGSLVVPDETIAKAQEIIDELYGILSDENITAELRFYDWIAWNKGEWKVMDAKSICSDMLYLLSAKKQYGSQINQPFGKEHAEQINYVSALCGIINCEETKTSSQYYWRHYYNPANPSEDVLAIVGDLHGEDEQREEVLFRAFGNYELYQTLSYIVPSEFDLTKVNIDEFIDNPEQFGGEMNYGVYIRASKDGETIRKMKEALGGNYYEIEKQTKTIYTIKEN